MLTNTTKGYGFIHIAIHWVVAGLIAWAAYLGLTMTDMPDSFDKLAVYSLHKSLGMTVFVLAILRLVWKLANNKPLLPEGMVGWERTAAHLTHHLFYVLLFLVPLLGWLTSESAPFPLDYFGLFLVPMANIGVDGAKLMLEVHEWVAKFMLALIIIHALAALKHHFISKDDILKRMIIPTSKE